MAGARPRDGLRVLNLDGPPFAEAALSELFFLQQIAHRWVYNEDDEELTEGDDVHVSDMFDIIGGSGIGGLYAILFARLNISISQAIHFHKILTGNLFTAACWTQMDHQECSKVFDDALDQMVSHSNIAVDLNSPFLSKDFTKCFIVVLNKTQAHVPSPRLLRSYRVRVGSSPHCTIRQALHATLADMEHLPAVVIDDEHFISSSAIFCNPSRIILKDLAATFPKLHLACLLNIGADHTHPPNDSRTVGQDLMAQFRNLGCFFRLSVREELHEDSEVKSLVMGYLQEEEISKMSDDIVDALKDRKRVVNLLRLGDLAGRDGKLELQADVSQLRNEGEIKRALEKIRGPFDFRPLHEHGCLEGTRVDVLGHIEGWAKDVNAPNVFWLEGYPGTGKTFISISLKHCLAEAGLLGASCFFRREDASHHRLDTVVRSIAFQLANNHSLMQGALVQALNSGAVKFEGASANLFAQLIYDPLTTTCADSSKCIVIVLDALDEFGQSDADQHHLLTHLLPRWTQLPPCYKLFIASRSQGILPRHLDLPVHMIRRLTVGDEASTETMNDIRTFFKHSFQNIQNHFNSSTALVTDSQLETLVSASSGLFIWASTVIQMVKQKTLRSHARRLLQSLCTQQPTIEPTRMQPVYKLYRTVLIPLLNPDESHVEQPPGEQLVKETFFSAVARARIPLSANALASLCKIDVEDIHDIVLQLAPVIDSTRGLRFVHKSFVDFIASHDFPLLLNFEAMELNFTESCFKIMHAQLHFNMGKMPSSYMLNSQIPELPEALSAELRYASQFWGSHLKVISSRKTWKETTFNHLINSLLNHHFLYWVEAVSILGCFQEAIEALLALNVAGFGKAVSHFAQDALAFFRQFAMPISQSYPHIYISAMPWTSTTSLIRAKYLDRVPHMLKVVSGGDAAWPAQLAVIQGHSSCVSSVALSPNGSQIVSGSDDKTVRIWDVATRQSVGQPRRGHDSSVNTVAFSPDGSQIVSGSSDKTVQVWDAATLRPIGGPLRGHDSCVCSVAYSPDGSQIVSGSRDKTVRIWDAATRQPIGEPLRGYDSSVNSVAFSPDGSRFASGSNDMTIRVWDAAARQLVGETLRTHKSGVQSIAFSPDGSQIVSGSADSTVRIWDAVSLQQVGEPLRGHATSVNSVAFSLDGSQIVSGSLEGTIQIWDAATRQPAGEPLRSHNNSVHSVAFSIDGSQIFSGFNDTTIRIWDVVTRQHIEEPHQCHDSSVHSIAFSPDGSLFVSGSWDQTVRIWDAATRRPVGGPLQGHDSMVNSVAFSPDGSQIVSGSSDKTIQIWDAATLQPIGGPLRGHDSCVCSVAYSPDGSQIVSGSRDKTVRIWDVATHQPIGGPLRGYDSSVNSVAFSPDGSRIVSGSNDMTIRIWDAAIHQLVGEPLRGHNSWVCSVAYSPDGSRIVSGSDDRTVRIWNAATRQPVGEPLRGHHNSVNSVAFSPDGSQIVSGSIDMTIRIWDVATLQPVGDPLRGHNDSINSVAFSLDGSQIVSGSADMTIRIWDVVTLRPNGDPLRGHNNPTNPVAATLDGSQIVSGFKDTTIRVWNSVTRRNARRPIRFLKHLLFPLRSQPSPLHCFLLHSGWVVDQDNFRLLWIPQHFHEILPLPGLVDIIGPRRMLVIDTSDIRTGIEWST